MTSLETNILQASLHALSPSCRIIKNLSTQSFTITLMQNAYSMQPFIPKELLGYQVLMLMHGEDYAPHSNQLLMTCARHSQENLFLQHTSRWPHCLRGLQIDSTQQVPRCMSYWHWRSSKTNNSQSSIESLPSLLHKMPQVHSKCVQARREDVRLQSMKCMNSSKKRKKRYMEHY